MPNSTTIIKNESPILTEEDRNNIKHKIKFLKFSWNIGLINTDQYIEGRHICSRGVDRLIMKRAPKLSVTHKDHSSTPTLVQQAPNDISELGDKLS